MSDEIQFYVMGAVMGIIGGILIGFAVQDVRWQSKAVEAGKAEYYLAKPTDQNATWRWKP